MIRRTVLTTTLQSTMTRSTSDDVVDSATRRRTEQRQRLSGRLTGLLSAAVKHRDPAALQCLMEKHDVDANSELVQPTVAYRRRKTRPLHAAMHTERRGLTQRVDVLLSAGADPNVRDGRGSTPLHVATGASEAPAARLLLARGADPNAVDGRGETALHCAARQGHCELVRALLHHGADQFVSDRTGLLPVHVAAVAGNYHIVEMLCGADRRAVEAEMRHRQRRPIHLAAGAGHVETVALLADRLSADVTCRDADGNTPLHAVVAQSHRADRDRDRDAHYACAAELLRHDVAVDTPNAAGQTPLALAAANRYPKIAQLLLASGAQPLTTGQVEAGAPPQKQRRVDRKKTSEKLSAAEAEVIADRIRKKPTANVDESGAVEGRTTGEQSQRSDKPRRSSSRTSSASEQTPPRHVVDPSTDSVKLRKTEKSTSRPGVDNEISTFSVVTKGSGERMCILLDQKPSPQDVEDRIRSRRSIEGEMKKAGGGPKHDIAKKLVAVEIETDESMEVERKQSSEKKQPRRSAKDSSRQGDAARTRDKDQEKQQPKDRDSFAESKEANKGSSTSTQQTKQPSQPPTRGRITDSPADEIFLDPERGAQEWFGRPGAVSPVALKDVRTLSVPGFRSTSKSPSGFVSEGGGMRGLKLRVAGVVPKAYNRRQKDAARRAFFAARPVAIESIGDADLDDVSQVSMASMPEIGYEAWERSVQRHHEWSEPLEPVYGKPPKHHGLNVSFTSSRESPAPTDDKVLIGPYAPPYRSTGPINVKTDLIEEMLLDDNLSYDYDSMEWNDNDVPDPQFGDIDDIVPHPPPQIMDRHQAVEELLRTSPTENQRQEDVDEDGESRPRMGPPEKTSLPAEKIEQDKMRKAEIDKAFEEAKRRLSQKTEPSADVPQKSKRDKKKRRPEASVTTSKAETEPEEKKQKPQKDTGNKHITKESHEVHFEEHEIRTVVHSSTVMSSQSTTSKIQRLAPENFVVTADLSSSSEESEDEGQDEAPSDPTAAVAPARTQPSPVKGILKSTSKYRSYDEQPQPNADKDKTLPASKIPVSIFKTDGDKKKSSRSGSQQHPEEETPEQVDDDIQTDEKQSGLEQDDKEPESTGIREPERSDRDESKVPQEKVSRRDSGRDRRDKDRSRIPVPSKDTEMQSPLVPLQPQATERDDRTLSTTEEQSNLPAQKKERGSRRKKAADDSKKRASEEQQKVSRGDSGRRAKDSEATQQPQRHQNAEESSTMEDETTERGTKVISLQPATVEMPKRYETKTTLDDEYSTVRQEVDTRKIKTSKQRERAERQEDALGRRDSKQKSSTMEDETTERGTKVISLQPATVDVPKRFETETTLDEEYLTIRQEADTRKKKTISDASKHRERARKPARQQDAIARHASAPDSSTMEDETTERGTKVISLQPATVDMPKRFEPETPLDEEYSTVKQEADTRKNGTSRQREREGKPARQPDAVGQDSSTMEDETTERGAKVISLQPATVDMPKQYKTETTLNEEYSTVIRHADSRKKKTSDRPTSKQRERAKQPERQHDDEESSTMKDETTERGTKVISLQPATEDVPKQFQTETTLDDEYSTVIRDADSRKKRTTGGSKQRERAKHPVRELDAVTDLSQRSSTMEDETTERGTKVISVKPATTDLPQKFETETTLEEEYSTVSREADTRKKKTSDRPTPKERERERQPEIRQDAEESSTMEDETTERGKKVISLQPATVEMPQRVEPETTLDNEYSIIKEDVDPRKKKPSKQREHGRKPARQPDAVERRDSEQKSSTMEDETTERGTKVISLQPATVDMPKQYKTETNLDEEYSVISREADTREKKTSDRPTSKEREREKQPEIHRDAEESSTMEDETTERGTKVISLQPATVEMPKRFETKTTLDEEYSTVIRHADSHEKKTTDASEEREIVPDQDVDKNANANVSNINAEYNEEPGSRRRKPRDRTKQSRTQEDQQNLVSDESTQPTGNIDYDSQPVKHDSRQEVDENVDANESNIEAEYSDEPGSRRRKPRDRTKQPQQQPSGTQEDQQNLVSEESDQPTSNINYDSQPVKHEQPDVSSPAKSSTDRRVKTTATEDAGIPQSQSKATAGQDDQRVASGDTGEEPARSRDRKSTRHTKPRDTERQQHAVTSKDTASHEAELDAVAENEDAKSGSENLPPEKKTRKSVKSDVDDARRSKADSTAEAAAAATENVEKEHGREPEREGQKRTRDSRGQESKLVEREADVAITSFEADESRVGTLEPSSSRVERLGETAKSELAGVQPSPDRVQEQIAGGVESYDAEPGSRRKERGDRRKKKDSTQRPSSSEPEAKTREDEQRRPVVGATDEQIHQIVIEKAKEEVDKAPGDRELLQHLPKGPAIRPDVWEEAMNDEPLACSDVVYDDVVIPTEEMDLPPSTEYTTKPNVAATVRKDKPRKTLAPPRERKKPRSPKLQSVKETSFDEEISEESSSESFSSSEEEEEETKPTQRLSHDSSSESFSDEEQEVQYDREPSRKSGDSSTVFDAKESYGLPTKYDGKTSKESDTGGKIDRRLAKETDVDEEFGMNFEESAEISVQEDFKETNVDDDAEETDESQQRSSDSDVAAAESTQEPARRTAKDFRKTTEHEKKKEPWKEDDLSDYDIPVPGVASKSSKDAKTEQTAVGKETKEKTVDYKGGEEAEVSSGDEDESEADTEETHTVADAVEKHGDADGTVKPSTISGPSARERRPRRPKLPSQQDRQQVLPPKSLEETESMSKKKKRQAKSDKAVYRVQEAEQQYERKLTEDAIRVPTEPTDQRKPTHDTDEDKVKQPTEKIADIDLEESFEEWTSDEDEPPLIVSGKDAVQRIADKKDDVGKDKGRTSQTVDRFDKEPDMAIDEDNLRDTHARDSSIQQPNNLRPTARRETSYQETSFDDVEPVETTQVELETTEDKESKQPKSKPVSVSPSKDRRKKSAEKEQNADDEEMFPTQHLKHIGKGRVKKTDQRKRLSASLFVDPNADNKHTKAGETEDVESKPETVPSATHRESVDKQKQQERTSHVIGETNLDDLSDEETAAKPRDSMRTGFDREIDTETAARDEDEQNKAVSAKKSAEELKKKRRDKKRHDEPAGPTSNELKFTEDEDAAVGDGASDSEDDYRRQTVTIPQPQQKYQQYDDDDDVSDVAEQPDDEATSLTLPQKRGIAEDGKERSSETKKKTKKDTRSTEDTTREAQAKRPSKREPTVAEMQISPSSDVGEDEEMEYISQPPPAVPQVSHILLPQIITVFIIIYF